jgi:hypothetical protein
LSFFKKIKESLRDPAQPKRTMNVQMAKPIKPKKRVVQREYMDFSKAYRIGILSKYSENFDAQKSILNYKKELERLGFECEVLLFIDKREKDPKVYLPSFNLTELDKDLIPNSPRTDRFVVRKFDLLFNLYFETCPQLLYLATESKAKCRVSPYLDFITPCSDVLIPTSGTKNIDELIKNINETLKIQKYVRPKI